MTSFQQLQAFSTIQLKELLLQYNLTDCDIEGKGKNGCILKQDRIDILLPQVETKSTEYTILIFDFVKYKHEHQLMQKYYKNLELMLRTALFIDYKYNHLPPDQNTIFEEQIKTKKTKKDKLKYISLVLDSFEVLYIVEQWFNFFAPEKPDDFASKAIDKYKFHIDAMFNRMYKARCDAQWDDTSKLWFS